MGTPLNRRTSRWLMWLFILALSGIIFAANRGMGPSLFSFVYMFPGGDKLGHLFLMGMFSLLVNIRLHASVTRVGPVSLLKGSSIVLAIVTLEEISQLFLASRTFSLVDLASDYVGIIIFGKIAARITKRHAIVLEKEAEEK